MKMPDAQEPGTYYYGAIVDAVAGETNTSNNASSAVRVTVIPPYSYLDYAGGSIDDAYEFSTLSDVS